MIFRAGVEGGRGGGLVSHAHAPQARTRFARHRHRKVRVVGAPYEVQRANHPFFQDTGLRNGEIIGDSGLNIGFGNGRPARGRWIPAMATEQPGSPSSAMSPPQSCLPDRVAFRFDGVGHRTELVGGWPLARRGDVLLRSCRRRICLRGRVDHVRRESVVDAHLQQIVRNALVEALVETPRLTLVGVSPSQV